MNTFGQRIAYYRKKGGAYAGGVGRKMLRNAPSRIQMGERHQRARRREEEARHKKGIQGCKKAVERA